MTSDRWNRIQYLFETALEKSPEERETYLIKECAGDTDLLDEVKSLLEADTQTHSLLNRSPFDLFDLAVEILQEGNQIGSYQIVRQIGIGGMGAVYLAERADGQFEQQVALKIIKPGMDSREILKRFQRERQILAKLNHPNIARLLDGGITEKGFPYFTLEYVEGRPIDRYCDEEKLSIHDRLSLFCKVCEAVQYAHQNLVIHRDLKPSNILITRNKEVKLLDFGIATVLSGEEDKGFTLLTGEGGQVMTPEYASPEQVKGDHITTASDVYSLGVILYELLCGQRPYKFEKRTPLAIERIISESNPHRPSTVFNKVTSEQSPQAVSSVRKTVPERLCRRLEGDLDNICLMALEKEPEHRYPSVDHLLLDIKRHLTGRPVLARASTIRYRLHKFIQRHKTTVIASAAILLMLIGLVTYYTLQLAEERDLARREARKSSQIASFMTGIFKVSDPSQARGESVTARELLDRGANRIQQELQDQPEVQALMLEVVGEVYASLGLYEQAHTQLKKSLEMKIEIYGNEHEEIAGTLNKLGVVLIAQREDSLAESVLFEALQIQKNIFGEGKIELAPTYHNIAWLYNEMAYYQKAEEYYQLSMKLYEEKPEESRQALSILLNNYALLKHERGDYQVAKALYYKSLEMQLDIFGELHPEVSTTKYNLSQLLWDIGEYEKSEELKRDVVRMDRKLLGNHHPDLAYSLANLAKMFSSQGRYDSSEVLFREALKIRQESLGENHPQVVFSLNEIGSILYIKANYTEAEQLHRRALKLALDIWGERHSEVARSYRFLGRALSAQDKNNEARFCFEKGLQINQGIFGNNHPYVGFSLMDLGIFLEQVDEFGRADSCYREAKRIYIQNYGEEHPAVASSLRRLASIYQKTGKIDSAEVLYNKAFEIILKQDSPRDPDRIGLLIGLGSLYLETNQAQQAEFLLRQALQIRNRQFPQGHWKVGLAQSLLGASLAELEKPGEADILLTTGYQDLKSKLGADHRFTREAYQRLVKYQKQ